MERDLLCSNPIHTIMRGCRCNHSSSLWTCRRYTDGPISCGIERSSGIFAWTCFLFLCLHEFAQLINFSINQSSSLLKYQLMHYSHEPTRGSSIGGLLQESTCQKCGRFLVLDLHPDNTQQIQEHDQAKVSKPIYTTDSIQSLLWPIYCKCQQFQKYISWLWNCLPTTHQEYMNPLPIDEAQSISQAIILYIMEWVYCSCIAFFSKNNCCLLIMFSVTLSWMDRD